MTRALRNIGFILFFLSFFVQKSMVALNTRWDNKIEVSGIVNTPQQETCLKLARPFMDHMVLQQKQPVPVWGTCHPDVMVTVVIGPQKKMAKSDSAGVWRVVLEPLVPGKALSMKVSTTDGESILLEDVLVGEVWLCAGQSNMEFPLSQSEGGKMAVTASGHPDIRLFNFSGIVRPDNAEWDAKVLDRLNKFDFFEGKWERCSPETSGTFSAIGYFFGEEISRRSTVPVGLIEVTVGGAPAEAFVDRNFLQNNPVLSSLLLNWKNNEFIMDWCKERMALNLAKAVSSSQRHPFEPAFIFEAGIACLAGFPLKGVIFYQGESNTNNPILYETLFPVLVNSWRKAWNVSDLPFYFAQLSGIERKGWPEFRDMQLRLTAKIQNSGMVVTFDLGDSLNVHPIRKKEVGLRFAALALHHLYKDTNSRLSPELASVEKMEDHLNLSFNHAREMKTSDGALPREIEVAGIDGIFKTVKAKISGNEIIAETKGMDPVVIRYGWKPYSRGNLVNESNLPLSTFKYLINK